MIPMTLSLAGRTCVYPVIFAALCGCSSPAPAQPASLDGNLSLELADLDGRNIDLQSTLDGGTAVALVFWQPGCSGCQNEAPRIAEAARRHGGSIRFVGIIPGRPSLTDAEVRRTASEWGYGFIQIRDADESLCRAAGVTVTPTLLVLGSGREVRYRGNEAPRDWEALATAR